jgi:hypothetical protein
MKKITFLLTFCTLTVLAMAYPQTLPINYSQFFATSAMGTDPTLEKGIYTSTSATLMANQWNRSGKLTSGEGGGVSPVVEANGLGYSNYIDNYQGKSIILAANIQPDPLVSGSLFRSTIFSLTSVSTDYTDKAFYAGMLVNFSSVTGSGVDFFAFDSNYTGNSQRGRIFIKASVNLGYYNMGIGWSGVGDVLTWSPDLAFNTTYFIVAKNYPLSVSGNETIALYINPTLGETEANSTINNSGSYAWSFKKILGLTIRQRPEFAGKVAGLRFSDNWADIVKGGGIFTSLNNTTISNFVNVIDKTIQLQEVGNVEVYNFQGAKLLSAKNTKSIDTNLSNGLYIVKFTNSLNQQSIQKITIR